MLTDRISNMQGAEPSVQKRGHAGWMLASCVAISVVLCYGQISNSKAVIGLCLLAFLGVVVLACRKNAVLAVLLYFLPWSPLLRLDNKSFSFLPLRCCWYASYTA